MNKGLWGVWCVEDRQWCFKGTRDEAEAELPRWASGRAAAVDPNDFHYEIRCCTVLSHGEMFDEIARQRDMLTDRCRDATRALVEAIGAPAQTSLEDAVALIVDRLRAAETACVAAGAVSEWLSSDDGMVSSDTTADFQIALNDWRSTAAATREGDVAPPCRVTSGELMRRGGEWLGVARNWIKCKARNGESVTWGSRDVLERAFTVDDIECLAAEVASVAMRPQPDEASMNRMRKSMWTAQRLMQEANKTAAEAQEETVSAKNKMRMAQDQVYEAVGRAKQAEATRDGAQKAASDAVDRARIAEKERDEALAKYQFMVNRAASEKLDGYRELGEKVAHAQRESDDWREVARMWETIARKGADLAIDIEKLYHPDSDNEEIGALVVWSESVRDLPPLLVGNAGEKETET